LLPFVIGPMNGRDALRSGHSPTAYLGEQSSHTLVAEANSIASRMTDRDVVIVEAEIVSFDPVPTVSKPLIEPANAAGSLSASSPLLRHVWVMDEVAPEVILKSPCA
jgi:hypothetical protein